MIERGEQCLLETVALHGGGSPCPDQVERRQEDPDLFDPQRQAEQDQSGQTVLAKQAQRGDQQKDGHEIQMRDQRYVKRPTVKQPESGREDGGQQLATRIYQQKKCGGNRQVERQEDRTPKVNPRRVVAQARPFGQGRKLVKEREIGGILVILLHVAGQHARIRILPVQDTSTLYPGVVDVLFLCVNLPEAHIHGCAGQQNDEQTNDGDRAALSCAHGSPSGTLEPVLHIIIDRTSVRRCACQTGERLPLKANCTVLDDVSLLTTPGSAWTAQTNPIACVRRK